MNGLIISLLVFIAVVVVLAVGIGFFFASRARTQAEHRVAAEELRSDAQGIAPAVAGQEAFAEQSEQRAEVARAEALDKAREADELAARVHGSEGGTVDRGPRTDDAGGVIGARGGDAVIRRNRPRGQDEVNRAARLAG